MTLPFTKRMFSTFLLHAAPRSDFPITNVDLCWKSRQVFDLVKWLIIERCSHIGQYVSNLLNCIFSFLLALCLTPKYILGNPSKRSHLIRKHRSSHYPYQHSHWSNISQIWWRHCFRPCNWTNRLSHRSPHLDLHPQELGRFGVGICLEGHTVSIIGPDFTRVLL